MIQKIKQYFKKARTTSVIEITDKRLKFVQGTTSKKESKITKLIWRDITGKSDAEISKIIVNLLQEEKIKLGEFIFSIPRFMLTVRSLNLPSKEKKEIENMLRFQITKILPFAPEEVIYDFQITEIDQRNYAQVVVVLAHRDIINRNLKIIGKNLAQLKALTFSSMGLSNLYIYSQKAKVTQGPVALINVDYDYTDICILQSGKLAFTRSIHLSANQPYLPSLIQEIRLSINTYCRQSNTPDISKIVIMDSLKDIEAIETIKKEFNYTVETINLQDVIVFPEGVMIKEQDLSFSSVIGLFLSNPREIINLLPQDIKTKKDIQTKAKESSRLFILTCLALLSLLSVFLKNIFDKNQAMRYLDKQIARLNPQATAIDKAMRQLELIKNQMSRRKLSLETLREIYSLIPDTISLNLYIYEDGRFVSLKGQAKDLSCVFSFVNTLEKSTYFHNVKVKYATKRKLQDREIVDFEIQSLLSY